jgi:hypothetical protein
LKNLQEWGWWALGSKSIYFFEGANALDPQVQLKALDMETGRIDGLTKLPRPVLTATPALAILEMDDI